MGFVLRVASYGLRVTGYGLRVACYGLRVTGYGQKGHIAEGIAHRARPCSMEGAGGSKGLRVYMVDWLAGLNKLIE